MLVVPGRFQAQNKPSLSSFKRQTLYAKHLTPVPNMTYYPQMSKTPLNTAKSTRGHSSVKAFLHLEMFLVTLHWLDLAAM